MYYKTRITPLLKLQTRTFSEAYQRFKNKKIKISNKLEQNPLG